MTDSASATDYDLVLNLGTARRMCGRLYKWADEKLDGSVPGDGRAKALAMIDVAMAELSASRELIHRAQLDYEREMQGT